MIVHRLLDVLFRGLDAVDAARDRVDSVLGREPRPDPWAVEWPPEGNPTRDLDVEAPAGTEAALAADAAASDAPQAQDARSEGKKPAKKASEPGQEPAPKKAKAAKGGAAKSKATKSEGKSAPSAKKSADGKAGRKKSKASKRKGSVDRKGKDLSTARAEELVSYAQGANVTALSEEADIDGKKVLGRVVWALAVAEQAGFEEGLTTKDMSAFLSAHAHIEVFTTNIGRACRDYDELIAPSVPDGRSKRYRLTPAGQKRAQDLLA